MMKKVITTMIEVFKTGYRIILTIVQEMTMMVRKTMTKMIQAFKKK